MAISMEELLESAMNQKQSTLWTSLLGQVVSYDDVSQTANVQPIPAVYLEEDSTALPVLQGIRVCFPGTNEGGIKYKLASGHTGEIHFSARSIARFQQDGSIGDPNDTRMHDLSDAWFVPSSAAGAAMPTETGGSIRIYEPSGAKVSLGSKTTGVRKAVARQDDTTSNGALGLTCGAVAGGVLITMTYTPPSGGIPQIQTITLIGAITGAPVGLPAALVGSVNASSTKVEAG